MRPALPHFKKQVKTENKERKDKKETRPVFLMSRAKKKKNSRPKLANYIQQLKYIKEKST